MQFIETALAFAITMLVLSMVVSTFVELIHRVFSMREGGLKRMLDQVFDQVLAKYIDPARVASINNLNLPAEERKAAQDYLDDVRNKFVARMTANRAPMGVTPHATPAAPPEAVKSNNMLGGLSLWNGRDLASMTAVEFMERLGSIDVGKSIEAANQVVNQANDKAIQASAAAADVVLKDIAQKFEAFGKEAGSYFEGRARLLSVIVAVVFAFAVHIDAIDLFKTFLRDPNVRAKVIDQTQAVLEQQRVSEAKVKEADKTTVDNADVEKLKKDLQAAIDDTKKKMTQLADLSVPIGWKADERDTLNPWKSVPSCSNSKDGSAYPIPSAGCAQGDKAGIAPVGFKTTGALFLSLLLGGFLIGIGGPFWYQAVMGLTNLRGLTRGAATVHAQATAEAATKAGRTQPVTPVGVFKVSNAASGP